MAIADHCYLSCIFSSSPSFCFSHLIKGGILKMFYGYPRFSLATTCCLISLFLAPRVSANCYDPNGDNRNGNSTGTPLYQPCLPGDSASMCCRVDASDQCRSDGLCFDGTNLWRESCTDPTWASPSCIKLCVNGTGRCNSFQLNNPLRRVNIANGSHADEAGASMDANDEHVTQCSDVSFLIEMTREKCLLMFQKGSFCCGIEAGAKACCANNEGVWIVNGTTTNVNPSSATTSGATITKSIIVNPTSQAPVTATGTGSPSGSNHTGAIVGGVVGGLAVLFIIAAAAWFSRRWRAARRDISSGPSTEKSFPAQEMPVKEGNGVVSLVEAPNDSQLHEMDSSGNGLRPAELQ